MSRRPARCTQADLNRALKAVEKHGGGMSVDVLPDGTIRISPVSMAAAVSPANVESQMHIRLW
jgi:hypothetical protein